MASILNRPLLASALISICNVSVQVGLIAWVPPIGVVSYYLTVVPLEMLESAGMPTLTGSLDGWPVPTNMGLVIAAVGWFFVYFAPLSLWFVRAKRQPQFPA